MEPYNALLSPEQVQRTHEASLEILENVGLLVHSEKARGRFARHGCRVDAETQTVKFPRTVVEHWRAAFPPTFIFHGQDPQYDCTIPCERLLIGTIGSAPNIIDPDTGQARRANSDDLARIACLVNELPGYDLFGISTTADDAPPGQFYLSRFYPALKNCLKPVMGSAPKREEAEAIFRLGCLIAGSEDAYRARPFITYGCSPVISPLTMDVDSTEMLMHFVEEQLPACPETAPNAGLTAPLTLMGTLVQCNAEFLAEALLMQMTRPETLFVYGVGPTVVDMRTLAYASGGIETGILAAACVQMARYYNVPSRTPGGLTNAKVNDAQSGLETGMSAMAAVFAGVDLLSIGGLLDATMTFDFAKLVIDSEIALMLKRVRRGLQFSEENLALDVIAEVGPGGMFTDTRHTLKRMRTTALLPDIADRSPRQQWEMAGALDAQGRALQRVREILCHGSPAVFSVEVDAQIRAKFEDMVAGDVTKWDTIPHSKERIP